MKISLALTSLILATLLNAESVEEAFEGFDEINTGISEQIIQKNLADIDHKNTSEGQDIIEGSDNNKSNSIGESRENASGFFSDFSGKLTQEGAIVHDAVRPQNIFYTLRQSFFLDYEHAFENGLKVKINARAFYDPVFDMSNADYYPAEVEALRSEVELFEAYFEWNIFENFDAKWGRQVVVWGRSDTIRITDVMNPLDNRRPGIIDIAELRLPVTMLRFDYQIDAWRITPIVILEQRFTKDPPYGSRYNPLSPEESYSERVEKRLPVYTLENESYSDPTFALSIGADFEGWDVNFYASRLYEDRGYVPYEQLLPTVLNKKYSHNKNNMFGTALNYVDGSWLFKTELAYFSGLTYTTTQDRQLIRMDGLIGFEYSGFANTTISYDFAVRHFKEYDKRLYVPEENLLKQNTYQQALRINSNFLDDTLHANYLLNLYGEKIDEGGYHRAWIDYEIEDAINTSFGVLDFMGGSPLFELVKDQVVVFMDISYSF